jgi:hypothetical protein
MHNSLYNYITLKIEGCDNSASEDSRSQKNGIYNNFTKRLTDNEFEIIRCYVTSKCTANNKKKILCAFFQTIYDNTPYKYTMKCILKISTGSATKTKSPKAHTNKLGCQHRIQIQYVHSFAASLTFHDNPSSGSFQLLHTSEEMME